jgi:hypothetical protein
MRPDAGKYRSGCRNTDLEIEWGTALCLDFDDDLARPRVKLVRHNDILRLPTTFDISNLVFATTVRGN